MDVRKVDPRDATEQHDEPAYRVYFWHDREGGLSNDEWELRGIDVEEALRWARAHARGRSPSVWAVTPTMHGVALIRLLGVDLDRSDPTTWPSHAKRWTPSEA